MALTTLVEELEDANQDAFGEGVVILEKRIEILSGEESLLVKVLSIDNGRPFEITREELTKRSFFHKLVLHGLAAIENDETYEELRASIDDSEKHAPGVYYHNQLGFREVDGKTCFFGYHPVGNLSKKMLSSVNLDRRDCLEPRGSFGEWRRFVRKHFASHTERSLILLLGATAPVAYVLKCTGVFTDVPVWALVNSTSTGKTTMLGMIASMFANPRLFIDSFNATSNALYAMLEERGGYPFLCDEATHTPNIDWDAMLYTLPTGKEKRRCDSKGQLKPLVEFSGAVIMTSEVSILERSKQHGGQRCRIVEFNVNCFENDPELAEKTKRFCSRNYGWVTEPLLRLLLDESTKRKLLKKYEAYLRTLISRVTFEISGSERRLLHRMALILVSGWILQKAVKCDFHLEKIEKYLLTLLHEKISARDERDDADRILDDIAGCVCANIDKFPSENEFRTSPARRWVFPFWGVRGNYGGQPCIWIQEQELKNRILINDMKNPTSTMQKLLQKKCIVKFYDRYYHIRRDFGGVKAQYYCFLFPKSPSNNIKNDFTSSKDRREDAAASMAALHDIDDHYNMNDKKKKSRIRQNLLLDDEED